MYKTGHFLVCSTCYKVREIDDPEIFDFEERPCEFCKSDDYTYQTTYGPIDKQRHDEHKINTAIKELSKELSLSFGNYGNMKGSSKWTKTNSTSIPSSAKSQTLPDRMRNLILDFLSGIKMET